MQNNIKSHQNPNGYSGIPIGNCDFCFLKSKRKRIQLIKEGLNIDFWEKMEEKYRNDRQPIFDMRGNNSVTELKKIAKEESLQLSVFDDISFDCLCDNY